MGYESSSFWTKKSQVINDLVKSIQNSGWIILDQASTTQGAYFYINSADSKFIYCALIKKEKTRFYRKTMSEASSPSMNDCPKRFLKYEKTCGGYSDQWRESVLRFHESKKNKVDLIGQNIQVEGSIYKVLYKFKSSYVVEKKDTLQRFKLGPKKAKHAIILEKENIKDRLDSIE